MTFFVLFAFVSFYLLRFFRIRGLLLVEESIWRLDLLNETTGRPENGGKVTDIFCNKKIILYPLWRHWQKSAFLLHLHDANCTISACVGNVFSAIMSIRQRNHTPGRDLIDTVSMCRYFLFRATCKHLLDSNAFFVQIRPSVFLSQ